MNNVENQTYALIKNNIVVGWCFEPDKEKFELDHTLIKMTLENSPAYVNGVYINNKFYAPKETINN
jgi:hypothetical protein